MKIVVCTVGGQHRDWGLPASVFIDRRWISGGERSLYELAVATASVDADVELRGDLCRPALDKLARAAGAAPSVGLPPRPASEDDLLIVPEGWTDPAAFARVALTPSRRVIMMLAPPGLFGWSFQAGWEPPDPLTVDADDIARPETFRAMSALGFELWTHMPRLAEQAEASGVECRYIGRGDPTPLPAGSDKHYDVAVIGANRWAPLAERVLGQLGDVDHITIPEVEHDRLVELLGMARILIWPSRIEGHSRIQTEARAMGVVPVALSTNPYAVGLSEEQGAVVVDEVDQMPAAIKGLLADPGRLEKLSQAGMEDVRRNVEWDAYRRRVSEALAAPAPERDPGWEARAGMGEAIGALFERVRADQDAEMAAAQAEFDRFRSRRAVRVAARLADLTRPFRRSR